MKRIKRILTLGGATVVGSFLLTALFYSDTAYGEHTTLAPFQGDLDENICLQQGTPNLISNRSFEGNYGSYTPLEPIDDCSFGVCQTAQIPVEGGWVPFWRSHDPNDLEYIIVQPEYKPACGGTDPCVFPNRLRDGKEALQYFTTFKTFEAGIMQTIDVESGTDYCLSGWGHSWSGQDNDIISGPEDGELFQKIGIDPTGGTDWMSEEIIWSDQHNHPWGRIQYDEYGLFTVMAQAKASQVTIFMYSQASFAVKHNNVYWDDTHLSIIDSTYTTTITATPNINVLTTVTDTVELTQTVSFGLTGIGLIAPYSWSAAISPTNSITPLLSRSVGAVTETLMISVSTAGLEVGNYAADILLSTTPDTVNVPTTIPIRVFVADKIYSSYLPIILKE